MTAIFSCAKSMRKELNKYVIAALDAPYAPARGSGKNTTELDVPIKCGETPLRNSGNAASMHCAVAIKLVLITRSIIAASKFATSMYSHVPALRITLSNAPQVWLICSATCFTCEASVKSAGNAKTCVGNSSAKACRAD